MRHDSFLEKFLLKYIQVHMSDTDTANMESISNFYLYMYGLITFPVF